MNIDINVLNASMTIKLNNQRLSTPENKTYECFRVRGGHLFKTDRKGNT